MAPGATTAAVIALSFGCLCEPGVCVVGPPARNRSGPQLARRHDFQQGKLSAFFGPFRPSDEELRWYRKAFLGVDSSATLAPANATSLEENKGAEASQGLLGSLGIIRLSSVLGVAKDSGSRTILAGAAKALQLGREGGVWLHRRWRTKALYCLLGVYGIRIAGRVVDKIRNSFLSSSDIILDAEDRDLANRGAVLDVEGQALLLRLRALARPSSNSNASTLNPTLSSSVEDEGGGGAGWWAVESGVKRAIGLRCAAGKRAKYIDELADALRCLEQARDEADMRTVGSEKGALVEDAVVLTQVRLCDAYLRSLRDGLILASADFWALSSFWHGQKSNDIRMGVIKSFVLGTLHHGQVSGKRVAVERDQENISTSELLLERYLRRLGGIQSHLQMRPKASLETGKGVAGGTFTKDAVAFLEDWADDGMYLYLQSLEELEAPGLALRDTDNDHDNNGTAIAAKSLRGAGTSDYFPPGELADARATTPSVAAVHANDTMGACSLALSPTRRCATGGSWGDGFEVRGGGNGGSLGAIGGVMPAAVVLWPFPKKRESCLVDQSAGGARTAETNRAPRCGSGDGPGETISCSSSSGASKRLASTQSLAKKSNTESGWTKSSGNSRARGGSPSGDKVFKSEKGRLGEVTSSSKGFPELRHLLKKNKFKSAGARRGGRSTAEASSARKAGPGEVVSSLKGLRSVQCLLNRCKVETTGENDGSNGEAKDGSRGRYSHHHGNRNNERGVDKMCPVSETSVDNAANRDASVSKKEMSTQWLILASRWTRRNLSTSSDALDPIQESTAHAADKGKEEVAGGAAAAVPDVTAAGISVAGVANKRSVEATKAEASGGGAMQSSMPRSPGTKKGETQQSLKEEDARSGWAGESLSLNERQKERIFRQNRKNRIAAVKARHAAAKASSSAAANRLHGVGKAGPIEAVSLAVSGSDVAVNAEHGEAVEGEPSEMVTAERSDVKNLDAENKLEGKDDPTIDVGKIVVENGELGKWVVVPLDANSANDRGGGSGDGGFATAARRCVRVFCRSLGHGVSGGWGGVATAVCWVSLTAFRVAGRALNLRLILQRKTCHAVSATDDSAKLATSPAAPKYNWTSPFPLLKENPAPSAVTTDIGNATALADTVGKGLGLDAQALDDAAAKTEEPASRNGNSTASISEGGSTAARVTMTAAGLPSSSEPPANSSKDLRQMPLTTVRATSAAAFDVADRSAGARGRSWNNRSQAGSPRNVAPISPTTAESDRHNPISMSLSFNELSGYASYTVPPPTHADTAVAVIGPLPPLPPQPPAAATTTDARPMSRAATPTLVTPERESTWALTVPSNGVPERSGRRSRLLVGAAARSAKLAMPAAAATAAAAHGTNRSVGATGTAVLLTRALRERAAAEATEVGAGRTPPRKRLRQAIALVVCLPLGLKSGRYIGENWSEIVEVGAAAKVGLTTFFGEQLWEPCQAVVNNVFFRQRSNIMDQEALEDADASLRNMLRDFLEDTKYSTKELREKAVAAADMSVVSRQLEETSRGTLRGTLNGRIPRMLLIQVAFLKKELLQAMQAIDELFQANQVNLKLISVVPAALLMYVASWLSLGVVQAVTSRRLEPTANVHRSMRATVRELERLLTSSRGFVGAQELPSITIVDQALQGKHPNHHVEPGSGSLSESDSSAEASVAPEGSGNVLTAELRGAMSGLRRSMMQRSVKAGAVDRSVRLSEEETGKLALSLHELQTTLRQNHARFESRVRRKLEEDMHDLTRGYPTVSQQLAVVARMERSYVFLRPGGM